ncbi:MAG: VOC family protein [Cellulosilyticum sp.]|nr:VOC family protein [Cellulosilyticum sp.]
MKFNGLIPELSVSSIEVSKKFYTQILGFNVEYERTEDKFVFLSLGEAQIMLEEINGYWSTGKLEYPFGKGINFQIKVKDVKQIADQMKKHQIPLFRDIMESQYECNGEIIYQKEILLQDPDGYLLRFAQT